MDINTKRIKEGIITVGGKPFRIDMTIEELENLFNYKIKNMEQYVGLPISEKLMEDGETILPMAWFSDGRIDIFKLQIDGFQNKKAASEYLNNWLNDRNINKRLGEADHYTYYETDFGAVIPTLCERCFSPFGNTIEIELKYGELPNIKFTHIKKNKNNVVAIAVDDVQYKIQRVPFDEEDTLPYLGNWLGEGPMSIDESKDEYGKDDRKEIIYFSISRVENGIESVIGIAEFTYLAVWDVFTNNELFDYLDCLTEEWGMIGSAIEKYGCSLRTKKGITPYILAFEEIHDEFPYNEELMRFEADDSCIDGLFKAAMTLTSKYVKIPEEDMTLISVSIERDNMFSYYKRIDDVFINYQRSVKNVTVTKASGNASINSLKYQLNIPSEWARQIGLTKEDKSISMMFDGKKIIIEKARNDSRDAVSKCMTEKHPLKIFP
jgi:hypothetical protein